MVEGQSPCAGMPLRQRMIADMHLRGFSEKTRSDYIRCVKKFVTFLGRSPDTATADEVRRFQVHQSETGTTPATINITVSALRFFFTTTLDRPDLSRKLVIVRQTRKLPTVLSQQEVIRLLAAAPGPKYKAAFVIANGAGLRVSEVVALKVDDVDSKRMLIRVEQGKGRKDRNAMLSPHLLQILRLWWIAGKKRGLMVPHGWLFPGRDAIGALSSRQLHRVVSEVAKAAHIRKRVSPNTLRHSFATHLLEQKVDIRIIQTLLGYAKIETTTVYTPVALKVISEVESPLSRLKQQDRQSPDRPSG